MSLAPRFALPVFSVLLLTLFGSFSMAEAAPRASTPAEGKKPAASSLVIDEAYAKPTYGQTQVGAGFLRIRNEGAQADVLLEVSSPLAGSAEMHSSGMEGDIMRMRRIRDIPVAAGGTVALMPGGMHIMFFRLVRPLKAGDRFPVRLLFAQSGAREVEFEVRP